MAFVRQEHDLHKLFPVMFETNDAVPRLQLPHSGSARKRSLAVAPLAVVPVHRVESPARTAQGQFPQLIEPPQRYVHRRLQLQGCRSKKMSRFCFGESPMNVYNVSKG
jgi:hypothetical protein